MHDKGGSHALHLWDLIGKRQAAFVHRYGLPTIPALADEPTLGTVTQHTLQAMHQHFAGCLDQELYAIRVDTRHAYYLKLQKNKGVNKLVKKVLDENYTTEPMVLVDNEGNPITKWNEIFFNLRQAWGEYYQGVPKTVVDELKHYMTHVPRDHFVLRPVTVDDIQAALKLSNMESAPGIDQWRYGDLQRLPPRALEELAVLMNAISRTRLWPEQLTKVWMSAIAPSMGIPALKCRPISVLPVTYRLWGSVQLALLQEWLDRVLPDTTFAYRRARSAEGAATLLINHYERAAALGIADMHCVGIDLSKAFPSTSRTILSWLWSEMGGPDSTIETLNSYYNMSWVRWRAHGRIIDPVAFQMTNGLHQGCTVSVAAFNIVTAPIIHHINANYPAILLVAYADDLRLVGPSKNEIQAALNDIVAYARLMGWTVNAKKTQYWGWTSSANRYLDMDGHKIMQTTSGKVLGVTIGGADKDYRDTRARMLQKYLTRLKALPLLPIHKLNVVSQILMHKISL